jgi:hypothetical protein
VPTYHRPLFEDDADGIAEQIELNRLEHEANERAHANQIENWRHHGDFLREVNDGTAEERADWAQIMRAINQNTPFEILEEMVNAHNQRFPARPVGIPDEEEEVIIGDPDEPGPILPMIPWEQPVWNPENPENAVRRGIRQQAVENRDNAHDADEQFAWQEVIQVIDNHNPMELINAFVQHAAQIRANAQGAVDPAMADRRHLRDEAVNGAQFGELRDIRNAWAELIEMIDGGAPMDDLQGMREEVNRVIADAPWREEMRELARAMIADQVARPNIQRRWQAVIDAVNEHEPRETIQDMLEDLFVRTAQRD